MQAPARWRWPLRGVSRLVVVASAAGSSSGCDVSCGVAEGEPRSALVVVAGAAGSISGGDVSFGVAEGAARSAYKSVAQGMVSVAL